MIRSSRRHLAEVGENYFEHMAAAIGFSFRLAKASLACGLHALIPGVFTRTASRSVAELQAILVRRAAPNRRSDGHRLRIDA